MKNNLINTKKYYMTIVPVILFISIYGFINDSDEKGNMSEVVECIECGEQCKIHETDSGIVNLAVVSVMI